MEVCTVTTKGGRGRFPELVQGFRRRVGLTQVEAARRAGISVAALRDLEQGRVTSPRAKTIRLLASAFELSEVETSELAGAAQAATVGVRIEVLGPLVVVADGEPIDTESTIQRTVLALLALSPNTPVARDTLLETVWIERAPTDSVALLQSHISRLRRRLGSHGRAHGHIITATPGGYQLQVNANQVDLLEFRRLAAQAYQTRANGDISGACDLYREAASLWRGWPVDDVPELHAHPEVVGVTREWQKLVLDYATVALSLGRHGEVLPHLQRLTEHDRLHEAAHAHLMIAMAGTGQQAAALMLFDKLRRRLADELGADPGPELSEAHRRVLQQDISGPDPAPVSARRQLPPDIADFTGRDSELAFLHGLVQPPAKKHAAASVAVIEGMAGVGKTKLAVHFAHQLVAADQFADIQLYVDLHGHAERPPADPSDVLASFLYLLGVPGSQIPSDRDARATLYRDRLHDKNALVVLDNAADEDQVVPLLPAGPNGLVLVTTRRTLALDSANNLHLSVFGQQEAETLIARIAGAERVVAEPSATEDITSLCGGLPLALVLAARRLQTRPAWRVSDLTGRLTSTNTRLDELAVGSRRIRTVFDLSYQALPDTLAEIFRRLGLHPGDDFTWNSAAALCGYPPLELRGHLDRLVDEHLLSMASPDRYRFHDLLHDYALDLAKEHDGWVGIREGVERLLRWYLYAMEAAAELVPHKIRLLVLDKKLRPEDVPTFKNENAAFAWFNAETSNIVAAISKGIDLGLHELSWQLAVLASRHFEHMEYVHAWLRTCRLGVTAARGTGDTSALVRAITTLGTAYIRKLGDTKAAIECLLEGERDSRNIDDSDARARLVHSLGVIYVHDGQADEAIPHLHEALELYRQTGDPYKIANELSNLGWAYGRARQSDSALRYLHEAMKMRKQLDDDPYGGAITKYHLGETLLHGGQPDEAVRYYQELVSFFRKRRKETGQYRLEEADALEALGRGLNAVGRVTEARECWEQAMTVLADAGHPEADVIREWLANPPAPREVLPCSSELMRREP
jgi:DNA-binding SARP family transcriptional activator/DNA-binding XRE family transcriptional regulator